MDSFEEKVDLYINSHYELISNINQNFCDAFDKFSAKYTYQKDRNIYNWRNNSNPPSKKSIIEFVFKASETEQNTKDIDFINECDILLKAAGYSPLHSRNPKETLVKYCLLNRLTYDEYESYLKRLNNLIDGILDTQYDEELFAYMRSGKTNFGNLSKEEINEFENFISQNDIKKFKKTRLATIRFFSAITEQKRELNENTYTTRWFQEEERKHLMKNFEVFSSYLEEYRGKWTKARNSTIKALTDALFSKYSNQRLENVTIQRIASDFELFYYSEEKIDDLIIKNLYRGNLSTDTYSSQIGEIVTYKTDRLLGNILKGKIKINRVVLLQWLLFCELDIFNIDEYLLQAGFLPVIGYEDKDPLSNMIVFAYQIKQEFNVDISTVLKKLYISFQNASTYNEEIRFPLRSPKLEK